MPFAHLSAAGPLQRLDRTGQLVEAAHVAAAAAAGISRLPLSGRSCEGTQLRQYSPAESDMLVKQMSAAHDLQASLCQQCRSFCILVPIYIRRTETSVG